MTTWYVDSNAGTDSNASAGNGDSFATRRKSISNLVAAATAPGDTVRIMGSPNPTSVGSATWTEGPYSATFAPTSSTSGTPIVVTKAGHGLVTGDTIIINGHTTNTKANGVWDVTVSGNDFTLLNADGTNSVGNGTGGATGTVRKITACRVKLATECTKTVSLTGNRGTKTNWSRADAVNITPSIVTTDYKEGGECLQIAIGAGYGTGVAAYHTIGTDVDFSGYQQLSFWIKQTAGTVVVAGDISMVLSDQDDGTGTVNTFAIPALGALNQWVPITVNTGGNLQSQVHSVAFKVVTDRGAQTFLIDNIIAVKNSSSDDSLSLQSLIGKNTAGETFYGIQSINSTRIMLDRSSNSIPTTSPTRAYFGNTESVTTYKRETIKTSPAASSSTQVQIINEAGTSGSLISYSGGWDTTDMSSQTLETWFDGQNGLGYGLYNSGKDYIGLEKLAFVRYFNGINFTSTADSGSLSILACNNCGDAGAIIGGYYHTINFGAANNNITFGIDSTSLFYSTVTLNEANANSTYGLLVYDGNTISATKLNGNGTSGISLRYYNRLVVNYIKANGTQGIEADASYNAVIGASMSGNTTGAVVAALGKLFLINCTQSDSTPVTVAASALHYRGVSQQMPGAYTQDASGIVLNTLQNGTIASESSIRNTASGIAWKLSPTTATYVSSSYPFFLVIAQVYVIAGIQVTASVYMRRTNTGLTARLMCKELQINGVISSTIFDHSTNMTANADTWEQVIVQFTPTYTGVMEVSTECWGGTTYSLYVDDFSVTQG
jgi:hypothetical protein